MSTLICPLCEMDDILQHPEINECEICGHEWKSEAVSIEERIVKDANGNPLKDGDTIILIKDLRLKRSTQILKGGTKVKGIRLVDGDHEISCKIDGSSMALKACFVKKA